MLCTEWAVFISSRYYFVTDSDELVKALLGWIDWPLKWTHDDATVSECYARLEFGQWACLLYTSRCV